MAEGEVRPVIEIESLPGGVILIGKDPLSYAPNDFFSALNESITLLKEEIGNPDSIIKKMYRKNDEFIQFVLDKKIIETSSIISASKRAAELVSHTAHLTSDNPLLDYLAALKIGESFENPDKMKIHQARTYLLDKIYDKTSPLTIEQIREGLDALLSAKELMTYFKERHVVFQNRQIDELAKFSNERKELTSELVKLEFSAIDSAFEQIKGKLTDKLAGHKEMDLLYRAMKKDAKKENLTDLIQAVSKEETNAIDRVYGDYSPELRKSMKGDREKSLIKLYTDYFSNSKSLLVRNYAATNREQIYSSIKAVCKSTIYSFPSNDTKWISFSTRLINGRGEGMKKIRPALNNLDIECESAEED